MWWPDLLKIVFHCRGLNWRESNHNDLICGHHFFVCTCSFTVLSLIQHIIPDLCRHVAIFPQPVAEREHHYGPHDEEQRPCLLLHGLPASAWGINRGDGRHHRDQGGQRDTENQIWGQQVVVQALQVENRHIYIINRWAGWYRRTSPVLISSHSHTVYGSQSSCCCNVLNGDIWVDVSLVSHQ